MDRSMYCSKMILVSVLNISALLLVLFIAAETTRAGDRIALAEKNASKATTTQVWNADERENDHENGTGTPEKFLRHAQRIIKKFDLDGNGVLTANEWTAISANLAMELSDIDRNPKGVITAEELAAYLAEYAKLHPLQTEDTAWRRLPQPPSEIFHPITPPKLSDKESADSAEDAEDGNVADSASMDNEEKDSAAEAAPPVKKSSSKGKTVNSARGSKKFHVSDAALPEGLPDWFIEKDLDGDGQLTLGEFAPDGSKAQRQLFKQYDLNGDGVITPDEAIAAAKKSSGNKTSTTSKEKTESKAKPSSK
jgi:hypothetical protein